MAITSTNINTGGAVVKVGGTVDTSANSDGYYDMSVEGTDIGCTEGGVTLTYSIDLNDVFCDQSTPPVDTAIIGETATVEMSMLESTAQNIKLVLSNQASSLDAASAYWLGVGGATTISYTPVELVITDNDTGYLTTWTFFKCIAGGIEANFERENPTAIGITFTAYADTDHASGKQLFQIKQNKS